MYFRVSSDVIIALFRYLYTQLPSGQSELATIMFYIIV